MTSMVGKWMTSAPAASSLEVISPDWGRARVTTTFLPSRGPFADTGSSLSLFFIWLTARNSSCGITAPKLRQIIQLPVEGEQEKGAPLRLSEEIAERYGWRQPRVGFQDSDELNLSLSGLSRRNPENRLSERVLTGGLGGLFIRAIFLTYRKIVGIKSHQLAYVQDLTWRVGSFSTKETDEQPYH